jgi:branched-chain amino acid transport system permease protein
MKDKKSIILFIVVIAAFGGVPFVLNPERSYIVYLLFLAFTYIALTQGWNLLGGYTGQISLGQNAFFGLGAYVTAISWLQGITGYFDPLAMFLSGIAAAILAVAIGIPLLSKLRGDYFALGTLGLGEILRAVFTQGGAFTGGAAGIVLPSTVYTSMRPYYFMALFLASLATVVTYFMVRSRIGLALVAIREDELAAEANGINIVKYKILAFALGAFFAGLCGSLQAYYIFHIHPLGFFGLNWTIYPVLMCVLGGSGTIVGPIIGAMILTGVFEVAKVWLAEIHPIFSGTLIIIVMLFLPDGIIRPKRMKKPVGKGLIATISQLLNLKSERRILK